MFCFTCIIPSNENLIKKELFRKTNYEKCNHGDNSILRKTSIPNYVEQRRLTEKILPLISKNIDNIKPKGIKYSKGYFTALDQPLGSC